MRLHLLNIIYQMYKYTNNVHFTKHVMSHGENNFHLRNRSALAVNCWVIIHCLEVSCKGDQITSAKREWFICLQLTDKQWIITQQFMH